MPSRVLLAKAFETTHERETFNDFARAALQHWAASDELVIIIGNANLGSFSPDAVVLKQDALIVADFKSYSGLVTGSENGEWTAGNAPVRGRRGGENPFNQVRDYKQQLKRTLIQHFGDPSASVARTAPAPRSQWQATYLDHITGFVIFRGPIEDRTTLDSKTRTWFKVVDESNLITAIANTTSRLIDLSHIRMAEIAEIISGTKTEYVPPGTGLRAPGTTTAAASGDTQLPRELESKLAELRSFVGSTDQLLIVKGMVGTGLALLIHSLAIWLQQIGKPWGLLAPSRRLAQHFSVEADSIYSVIYSKSRTTQGETAIHELIKNNDSDDHIYVVTDAHLVSHSLYQTDLLRYGTGRLLDDLLTYADLANTKRKIIFVGDPYNLTRGKASESALSEDFIRSLTEMPVRVLRIDSLLPDAHDDPLILNCVEVGKALEAHTFTTLHLIYDETTRVRPAPSNGATDPAVEAKYKSDPLNVKYLAYTNRMVHDFNKWVRQTVFGRTGMPAVGDIVEFYQGIQITELDALESRRYIPAGTFAEVLEYEDSVDTIVQSLRGKDEPVVVHFSKVRVRLNPEGRTESFLAFRDFILDDVPELPRDYLLALQVAARSRARVVRKALADSEIASREPTATDIFEADPYLNAAQLRFGYALTAHHALGRQFRTVIANCEKHDRDNEDYFRFVYSLFAATLDSIFVISPPDMGVLTNAKWSPASGRLDETWKPNPLGKIEVKDGKLQEIYFAVRERLRPAAIDIRCIESHRWHEFYHLVSDRGCAKLRLVYNMKGSITTVWADVYTSSEMRDSVREALDLE